MAVRYMQMGLCEYPLAINECNMALEVSPRYGRAMLKSAKCYAALNRLDFANEGLPPGARLRKVVREKLKKKKGHHQKSDEKMEEDKEVVHKEVVQTDHVQENVLLLAESSGNVPGSNRLYITEVDPSQDPYYDDRSMGSGVPTYVSKPGEDIENVVRQRAEPVANRVITLEDWLVQFARLFKNHVEFDSDAYLDIHEVGMKLCSKQWRIVHRMMMINNCLKLHQIKFKKWQLWHCLIGGMFHHFNLILCFVNVFQNYMTCWSNFECSYIEFVVH
ncbi:hypothetical protein AHAS_Ahas11G0201700 [Arachis hypogaea]